MKALLMIDIQNDFLPGGSLEVAYGDQIIPVVNQMQELFDVIIATQDWHPREHVSFASNHSGKNPGEMVKVGGIEQVLWPDHCIQETTGAEIAQEIHMEKVINVIRKGTDPIIDSYSGFYDNRKQRATGLHRFLRGLGINFLVLTGLAADVCVKYTAMDALQLGYEVFLVEDATKAVGGEKALRETIRELKSKGVRVLRSQEMKDLLGN